MSQIISQRFDVDPALWDPQMVDTNVSVSGGAAYADIIRYLPGPGFRFLCVTYSTIRAYHDYTADQNDTDQSQHGVWAPCEQLDSADQFRVRFIFPTLTATLGAYAGWFEASFVKG